MTRTAAALERVGRPLRRASRVAWLISVAVVAVWCLALGAWGLRLGLAHPGGLVLVTWVLMALGAAILLRLAQGERRRLADWRLAEALERAGLARRGALVSLLDARAEATSPALLDLADQVWSRDVARHAAATVQPVWARVRHRVTGLALLGLAGTAALAAADPARGRPGLLWQPGTAMALLFAPVTLRAEPEVIEQGESVTLHAEAVGQRRAILWQRTPGQPWSAEPLELDSVGRATRVIGPLESDRFFFLESGRRGSDTVRVRVRLPAFVGSLTVVADYPAYLDLEPEPLPLDGSPLVLPAGTVLRTDGEASRPLREAAWSLHEHVTRLSIRGRRFSGLLRPRESGEWRLVAWTLDGAELAGSPPTLPLVLVPDSTPVVEVLVPGVDTVAPVDMRIPLVVDLRDDYGLAGAALVVRARSRPLAIESLPLPAANPDRALVAHVLDLGPLAPAPGDTVWYQVQAWDGHPARQTGRSREFVVVVPSATDQRQAQREAARGAQRHLDSLVAASRRVERQTEDLARQRARAAGAPSPTAGERETGPRLSFDEARRAEEALRHQESLFREAEALQQTLEALHEAAGRGEVPDTALARRLGEVSDQLRRALSPALRAKLAELERAIRALDPEATRAALEDLAGLQRELREALERSRELFRRAALEGEMAALSQEAGELAREQGAWNARVDSADSSQAAREQDRLATRADSLAAGLAAVAPQLDSERARAQTARTAEQAREAARAMRAAGRAVQQSQRENARAQGQQAEAALEQVQRDTEAQRQQQQDEWRQEVLDALDRALAETARLSRQQLEVLEGYRRAATAAARGEQGMVEEGVVKVMDQVTRLAGQNALVSPQIVVALAVARRQMAAARAAVSTGSANLREAAERAGDAVDALNVAALGLVRSRDDVAGAGSASGLSEALERMAQLAEQQGQLTGQSQALMPLGGSPLFQAQLRELARQQRAVAQQLERLHAAGQLPGARELGEEARELARRLEAERLDRETVGRQERLFRRMLDAGRTLQGDELDEQRERQAETARTTAVHLPAALHRRLEQGRVRFPTWEELQRLSPDARRLVAEYFRRLAGLAADGGAEQVGRHRGGEGGGTP